MAGRLRPTQAPSDEAQRVKLQIEARVQAAAERSAGLPS